MPFSGFIPGLERVLTLLHTLLASVDADPCYFVTAQTLICCNNRINILLILYRAIEGFALSVCQTDRTTSVR